MPSPREALSGFTDKSHRGHSREYQSRGHGIHDPTVLVCALQNHSRAERAGRLARFIDRPARCGSFGLVALPVGYDSGTDHQHARRLVKRLFCFRRKWTNPTPEL